VKDVVSVDVVLVKSPSRKLKSAFNIVHYPGTLLKVPHYTIRIAQCCGSGFYQFSAPTEDNYFFIITVYI
jgi:hypothetical protein